MPMYDKICIAVLTTVNILINEEHEHKHNFKSTFEVCVKFYLSVTSIEKKKQN